MKSLLYIAAITILGTLYSQSSQAQKKNVETITIKVDGVCGMCEERIENALSVKGVKKADWDIKSKDCVITYRKDKLSEKDLHAIINKAGHDTQKSKASDEQYDKVHHCCKYREMDTH